MILRIFAILAIIAVPSVLWAACGGSYSGSSPGTITAYDASQECVAAAVAAADNGDTVSIPAGSETWTVPVEITKAINIVGAGTSSTVLTEAFDPAPSAINYISFFEFTPEAAARAGLSTLDGTYTISVSNIGFAGQNPRTSFAFGVHIVNNTTTMLRRVKIYNNSFTRIHRAVQTEGEVSGVFYSNTLEDSNASYPLARELSSWDDNPVTPGSGLGWYIEDNTFSFSIDSIVSGGGHGMSHVIRYNTVTGSTGNYFESHGNQESGIYGTQITEAYGNNFNADTSSAEVSLRGGKGFIFFNKMKTGVALHVNEEYTDASTGTLVGDACVEAGPQVCAEDCVCMKVNHSFFFNNRKISDASLLSFHPDINLNTELAANREYWNHNTSYNGTTEIGTYCGSSLPANCTVGDGAWITSQACDSVPAAGVGTSPATPISGTLYRCTATDTWGEYYTPYTYPHPLRGVTGANISGATISGVTMH